jgi:hypothetical protein
MNNLVDSIFNMKVDVYLQEDYQDPNTGAIKKSWIYQKTIPCFAKGMISNSSTARSGDNQSISTKYQNTQTIEIRTQTPITYRQKVTNIKDSSNNVIWFELNYPNDTPTVFEIVSSTPITDPFGTLMAYNSIAKRSENQIIGD